MGHVPRRFAMGDFVDNFGSRESIWGFTKGIVCPGVNFETASLFRRKNKDSTEGWRSGHDWFCKRKGLQADISANGFEKHSRSMKRVEDEEDMLAASWVGRATCKATIGRFFRSFLSSVGTPQSCNIGFPALWPFLWVRSTFIYVSGWPKAFFRRITWSYHTLLRSSLTQMHTHHPFASK